MHLNKHIPFSIITIVQKIICDKISIESELSPMLALTIGEVSNDIRSHFDEGPKKIICFLFFTCSFTYI